MRTSGKSSATRFGKRIAPASQIRIWIPSRLRKKSLTREGSISRIGRKISSVFFSQPLRTGSEPREERLVHVDREHSAVTPLVTRGAELRGIVLRSATAAGTMASDPARNKETGLTLMSPLQTKPASRARNPSSFCFALMVVGLSAWSSILSAAEPPGRYLVVLEGEPAAAAYLQAKSEKTSSAPVNAAIRRAAEIGSQQDALSPQIRALGAIEIGRLKKLVNVMAVDATPAQAAA